MVYRRLVAGLFVVCTLVVSGAPRSAEGDTTDRVPSTARLPQAGHREAIRRMPLRERPDRPGHFYGNTVRRIHARRVSNGR
ncbi:MAG TPA: hypothetical protein VMY42_01230 [Thermoguttaceae bacterium]|nr:hypothetical protein [Thermoguttaceae bacterium]